MPVARNVISGILLDVEEVGAADVGVAVGVAGVEAGGLDGGMQPGVGDGIADVRVAAASLKRPRTLLMPAWRTLKPTSLCDMSSVQTPGVKPSGRVTTVSFARVAGRARRVIGVLPQSAMLATATRPG